MIVLFKCRSIVYNLFFMGLILSFVGNLINVVVL